MNDGDYNYAEAFRKMMFYKEHHRPIEDIVAELQHELSPVKEESILTHAMRMILELEYRTVSPLYQHLQSPMRQTLYLLDVYYSISDREELVEMDAERWNRIALLLDEIEMTYFINIGFPQKGVNKSTQILVVGQQDYRLVGEDGMSSKQEKAMALKDAGQDIEIMSEEQFLSMLGVEL